MTTFGIAPVKAEGATVLIDEPASGQEASEETYWIEMAFTKAQYQQMADALKDTTDPLLKELQQDFAERAVNGYGKGF